MLAKEFAKGIPSENSFANLYKDALKLSSRGALHVFLCGRRGDLHIIKTNQEIEIATFRPATAELHSLA